MAKRKIHLTESQLYGLVEQALNEISIETRASAADKASDERYMSDFRQQSAKRYNEMDKYEREKPNNDKRRRQENLFKKSVEDDLLSNPFVHSAKYTPHSDRGEVQVTVPVSFDEFGRAIPYHADPLEGALGHMLDYSHKRSYYENGKWMRPSDEGYDPRKSPVRNGHSGGEIDPLMHFPTLDRPPKISNERRIQKAFEDAIACITYKDGPWDRYELRPYEAERIWYLAQRYCAEVSQSYR